MTDYYFARWRAVADHGWWPILAAGSACGDAVRRLAAHRAIVLCEPDRLPLPFLYDHATQPQHSHELPARAAATLRTLAPRAQAPLQQRYRPDRATDSLCLVPTPLDPGQLDRLLAAQDELTDAVLAYYDARRPGAIERRTAVLRDALARAYGPAGSRYLIAS